MLTGAESYLKNKVETKQFVTFFPQNRALCLEEAALEDDLARRGDDNADRAVTMADLVEMKSTFLGALEEITRAMKRQAAVQGDGGGGLNGGGYGEEIPDTFRAARLARRGGDSEKAAAAAAAAAAGGAGGGGGPKKPSMGLKGALKRVSSSVVLGKSDA
jgi:hypothetical protein